MDVIFSDTRPFPHSPGHQAMCHNKILVVDDREALVGGMNVGEMFFRFHDAMIRLRGPSAAALGRQFDYDRQFALDPALPRPDQLVTLGDCAAADLAGMSGQTMARIVGTGIGRRTTEPAVLRQIRRASRTIDVAMSEMGDTEALGELVAAARRGVAVRVMLCPLIIGHYLPPALGRLRRLAPSGTLNAFAVKTLLAATVPVRLFTVAPEFNMMHMKLAIFDGRAAIVGSTNWTRGGFNWVGETDVELVGGSVLAELSAQYEQDWSRSVTAGQPTPLAWLAYAVYASVLQGNVRDSRIPRRASPALPN